MALRELCVHLTRVCNQRCEHCYYECGPEQSSSMPIEMAKGLIDQAKDAKVERVTLQGGEPLMYPEIEELCEYAKNKGLLVAIPTNGQLVNEKALEWIKKYVDIMFFSVHGDGEYHDKFVRCDGAYSASINGLLSCHNAGIRTGVLSSVTNCNKGIIPKLTEMLDSYCIPIHGILYHSEVGRGSNIKSMSEAEWDDFKKNMFSLQKKLHNTRIRFESSRQPIEYVNTKKPYISCLCAEKKICFVDTEGWIYPCSLAINMPQFRFGHIKDKTISSYFKDISWEWGYKFSELSEECVACEYLKICHGGCMVKRMMKKECYCESGKFIPSCVLYPDFDVYEEIIHSQEVI